MKIVKRYSDGWRRWHWPFTWLTSLALLVGAHAIWAENQEKAIKNPLEGVPEAIQEGKSIFRLNCGPCHGFDARGGRGPDLTSGRWLHGSSDEALLRTISKGLPGTQMPPGDFKDEEIWMLVSYLRSMSSSSPVPLTGNRESGERIFWGEGMCSQCHMVRGKGGRLGPELTRIGASRSPRFLKEAIRDPNKQMLEGYETVTVVLKDGRKITGVRKNEDAFSIQLMDQLEVLHLLLKKEILVQYEPKSLMPAYDERVFGEGKLQDLIAYLDGLRGNE